MIDLWAIKANHNLAPYIDHWHTVLTRTAHHIPGRGRVAAYIHFLKLDTPLT